MRLRGHTLIELLVVVTIVSIMAVVAIPLAQNQIIKNRIADLKGEILNVAAAQEKYFATNGQYASDVTSEVTTTLIPIPSDDIKGKLIGKEGRNITAFERAA